MQRHGRVGPSAAGAPLGAFVLASLIAGVAAAADISELRTQYGMTVGRESAAPEDLVSLASGLRCSCPDFCQRDMPGVALSARWTGSVLACVPDLVEVEAAPAAWLAQRDGTSPAVLGRSVDEVVSRYGPPTNRSGVAGGQLIYCRLARDYTRGDAAALTDSLIYYAFRLAGDRVVALRVGLARNCPSQGFLPSP